MVLKFGIIAFTAIPAAVLLYKIIQTSNILRFLFGLKIKQKKQPAHAIQDKNVMALDK